MSEAYVLALGSNMRVPGIGGPRAVIAAALIALEHEGIALRVASRIVDSAPVGPSRRRYTNAAVVVETELAPPELLTRLQQIERAFGRNRRGQPWRARPLDLDIVAWNGGIWVSPGLVVPHPRFRERGFVLTPAAQIAPAWRDPVSGLTLRQLAARAALAR
ncbi:2-amino-4-hydroxy-6-hydroxymethyldihydropteridine diphosphokinase [Erythrobacter mangrovi]|uniref:2-amino-4-hydroxy-6-hydroxymethyldihydropteridine pyrophosphokinase n=1 Tax=Erythrobacter mangrovi TaxID=2739433 RepID=A0A7D4AV58_9SPHN|nr:2-amino-4-hydroxy-6-hydroxymethyldihydropteridine diphosphokinase [Erythrobacter mangrovi]QKG72417.1 2-amino-4-hydroxy-6-hydroxymethyldihydropteridine diphosphokinase [Erythrobacter mangrovi]